MMDLILFNYYYAMIGKGFYAFAYLKVEEQFKGW